MQKCFNAIIFISIFVLAIYSTGFPQISGEIFTSSEANQKFGTVLVSVSISTGTLQSILKQAGNYIMFKIVNNSVIVIDNNRNVISPQGKSINSQDVFTLFSVSVLNDLLSRGDDSVIYVEQRSEVLSITYGGYTMEVGTFCPPFCG
jgi:hypothetical protein